MNWWTVVAPLIAGLALFYVQRIAARADKEAEKAEMRHKELEKRVASLELKVVADLPSREDFKEQSRRIESIASTLTEVRDMVLRMDAREAKG
ncbi:TPA: hypothetical protein UN036_000020 [Stenotrophomonas maltophilia]|uniref:hypothetical protein n=1 Tax=Stenotrophomonas maltophilia TaxID=40324 RepID=UPI0011B48DA8|nr:hypothetical protein [Stenotrophomonas maltophilia]MBN4945376.1 hypothetical protein [Stenotrophomonas maltophilia]HEL4660744.1 hypothetical protein [Stenotrophomonas maltophilia]